MLPEHVGRSRRFSLLYPKSVVPSRAVRALIDFVVADASAAEAALTRRRALR